MLEVYNEALRDLLATGQEAAKPLEVCVCVCVCVCGVCC